MASSLFGNSQPPATPQASNNPMQMMQQIKQFAGTLHGKNPQQLVMNLMKQRGIPMQELDGVMQQAREIAQMMGVK